MAAVISGHGEIVHYLVNAGADVNIRSYVSRMNYCLERSYLLSFLLNTQSGSTALTCAACRGRIDLIPMLIARGADVNSRDNVIIFYICTSIECGSIIMLFTFFF